MDNIIYIIETKKGKFKPFVASVHFMEDDNDSTLFVLANGPICDELKEAQKFATDNADEMEVYLNPVKSNGTGITWLSEIKKVN